MKASSTTPRASAVGQNKLTILARDDECALFEDVLDITHIPTVYKFYVVYFSLLKDTGDCIYICKYIRRWLLYS